jgi:hypothetical protein
MRYLIHRCHGCCCWCHLCLHSQDNGAKEDSRSNRQGRKANIHRREEVGYHNPICVEVTQGQPVQCDNQPACWGAAARQEVMQGCTISAQLQWATAANAQWMVGWQHDCNRQWRQKWATAGVTMEDSNSGGTIPMAINGGGAMDGRIAATAQWQLPWMVPEAKRAMAMATRVAGKQWQWQ